MIKDIRVGVPIIGSQNWHGGISYIELLVKAVTSLPVNERPQLFLIVNDRNLESFGLHEHFASLFNGIIFVGKNVSEAEKLIDQDLIYCASYDELYSKEIDFCYPINSDAYPDRSAASWIPDFQHLYLPEFFSEAQLVGRNKRFSKVAEDARLVVLSSQDAEKDFRRFYPDSKAITRVLPFYSVPQENWYTGNPLEVQAKYELPDKFLMCCNQFWAHKNHRLLFEAIALLKKEGEKIHLLCTGSTDDFQGNGYFGSLKQFIEDMEIADLVTILGLIPRDDQIQLIRRTLAVVQPSLFEGWSTVVEDCRVLGKNIILSDLPVNIEQNPEHAIYFNRHDAHDLANKILTLLPSLKPGPDLNKEADAREKSVVFARGYARNFCQIVMDFFGENPERL